MDAASRRLNRRLVSGTHFKSLHVGRYEVDKYTQVSKRSMLPSDYIFLHMSAYVSKTMLNHIYYNSMAS